MDALVMCGGRGTRLDLDDGAEKPLVAVGGRAMVDRVCDALAASRVDDVYAVVSPHTPRTRDRVAARDDVTVIDAPGDGYVADLGHALDRVETPVVTAAADLPLLTGEAVDRVLDRFEGAGAATDAADAPAPSLAVSVPVDVKHDLGASVDATTELGGRTVAPTGLNVVAGDADEAVVLDDERLAVNVNRPDDLQIAEELL